jgi:hypothetical protein
MEDEILHGHCLDHSVCLMKLGQLCTWRDKHEDRHKEEAVEIKKEFKDLSNQISTQKNWIITVLVALCLNLVATLTKIIGG